MPTVRTKFITNRPTPRLAADSFQIKKIIIIYRLFKANYHFVLIFITVGILDLELENVESISHAIMAISSQNSRYKS